LRAILWKHYGNIYRATRIAATFGKVLGAIFIGWGIFEVGVTFLVSGQFTLGPLWLVFIGLFLRNAAQAGYQQMALREAFAGLTVRDILKPEVITVEPDLTLDRLVDEYFYRYRFRSFPVLENGRLVGMVALKDLQAVLRGDWPVTRVRDAMHRVREENFVHPDDDLLNVFRKMTDADTGHLPVAQGEHLVGIVTRHDIMNLIQIKTDLAEESAARR
jgi:CBS domain-containing protein